MKNLTNIFKGIVIGIATLVPGVSGGTMAIILGIYDQMIHALGTFFKNIKENTIFLATLGVGGIIGIVAFSRLIEYSLENFKFPMIYLFLGIILGGIPVLYKKTLVSGKDEKDKKDWLCFAIGFLIILIMNVYNGTLVNLAVTTGFLNFLFLIIAGIIIAVALILPGISTSFMLLAIGLYDITLNAINNVDLEFLVPIIIGVGVGVITTTKILENLLTNKPRPTYMLILGFVLGSIIEVFPGIPMGLDIIVSLITFVLGFLAIRYMSNKYGE
jgi:putative membrane protein